MNSPCKLPAFVNIVDIRSLSLSLPILLVEILIYDVFFCACICAVHLPLSKCKPVVSSCGCFGYAFRGKLFRSPKGILRRNRAVVCFFVLGIVLFFEINRQLVFCVVSKSIAAYLRIIDLKMSVGGFSLVFSRNRNANYLIGGPSKIIFFVTEHRLVCDADKKCRGLKHHSDGVSFF